MQGFARTWLVIGLGAAAAVALLPSLAAADIDILEVKEPAPTVPIETWTPVQQFGLDYQEGRYGKSLIGRLMFADDLGNKFSQAGRMKLIDECFHGEEADMTALTAWAVCRADVKAFDMKKFEAELIAAKVSESSRKTVLYNMNDSYEKAKKIGAVIEAAAKTDPGVQQVLKVADDARAEWQAYVAKNKAQVDQFQALKQAVRSGKSNDPAFAKCWDSTQPAFAKAVKAVAKAIPWNVERGDVIDGYVPGYMHYLITTPELYLTAVSFGACAWSEDASAKELFRYAIEAQGRQLAGERTLGLSRLLDPNLKPKFADRSIVFPAGNNSALREKLFFGVDGGSPHQDWTYDGVVGTTKVNGDMTHFAFSKDKVEVCIEWKEHPVTHERSCKKAGMVDNQVGDLDIYTKFTAGLKPKVTVSVLRGFPVVAWQKQKLTALFTIPLP